MDTPWIHGGQRSFVVRGATCAGVLSTRGRWRHFKTRYPLSPPVHPFTPPHSLPRRNGGPALHQHRQALWIAAANTLVLLVRHPSHTAEASSLSQGPCMRASELATNSIVYVGSSMWSESDRQACMQKSCAGKIDCVVLVIRTPAAWLLVVELLSWLFDKDRSAKLLCVPWTDGVCGVTGTMVRD